MDKKYPIYSFSFRWSQDIPVGKEKDYSENWTKGLPEGRMWNSTGFSKMFKEKPSDEELQKILDNQWEQIKEKSKELNVSTPELKFKFIEEETWCLTWFEHYTFDEGQTDAEVLSSFDRYVDRILRLGRDENGFPLKALMGAEDRWRWHGSNDDGSRNEESPAPCRCKFCKEQGVIRIGH